MTTDQQQQPRTASVSTPTEREIRIERVFDAPRERVWAAFTDPALIPQWWGPTTVVDEMDVRVGGNWRFVARNENGSETASFKGTYREVTPPERIVQTFETAWAPGQVHIETFTFEDLGDQTKFTSTLLFDTTEERDWLLSHGAEHGANETYARLDELLARLASD